MTTSSEISVKKGSKSESGHAKNVANFEELITYVESLGALYNPAKEVLKLPSLQAKLSAANASLTSANAALTAYSNVTAHRKTAFSPLNKLLTRVNYSFEIADVSDEIKQNAVSILKKLKGQRISPKLTEEEKKALAEKGEEKNQISASHMSFTSRIENLDKFVKLLASTPQYAPNEEDLKTASLKSLYGELKAMNTAAIDSEIELKNARIARNEIMYKDKTGLVDIALEVKKYLISLDGPKGIKYKAISKSKFIDYNDK